MHGTTHISLCLTHMADCSNSSKLMNERVLMEQITFLQILCFWTFSIVLFYLKHNPFYI
jgi:hypothetical protein